MSPNRSRQWELKKDRTVRTVDDFIRRSPNLKLHFLEDAGDELRFVVEFRTTTLVQGPGPEPRLCGPVVAGIRYHFDWLSRPPHPTEIVTILMPSRVFHPNVNVRSGSLCMGHPLAGLTMDQILHTAWAAFVFNMTIVNTVDWQAFNRDAAAFVRSDEGTRMLPLTCRGLFEPPSAEEAASYDRHFVKLPIPSVRPS